MSMKSREQVVICSVPKFSTSKSGCFRLSTGKERQAELCLKLITYITLIFLTLRKKELQKIWLAKSNTKTSGASIAKV